MTIGPTASSARAAARHRRPRLGSTRSTARLGDDPWDDADAPGRRAPARRPGGQVDRLHARSLLHRRCDARRRLRRVVVLAPDQPRGRPGRAGELHRRRRRHPRDAQRPARGRGADRETPASSAGTSTPRRARAHAGLLRPLPATTWATSSAVLRTPPAETYTRVTFPEGFTSTQMARPAGREVAAMTASDFIGRRRRTRSLVLASARPASTSLEGLLFPDTYQVSNGENAGQVVGRMLALMERVGQPGGHRGQGLRAGPHRVRDPDHRLDGRARGEASARTARRSPA